MIPTYNYAQYLGSCIRSVLEQTQSPFEVLIVDDASTDETEEVAREFGDAVRYLRHDVNLGPAAAQNTGARNAGGELLAFLGADDQMNPDNLLIKMDRWVQHARLGVLFSNVEYVDSDGAPRGFPPPITHSRLIERSELLRCLISQNPFHASSAVVDRRVFEEVGGFDEQLHHGEDWDMWLKIAARYSAFYEARPLIRQRVHTQSLTRQNFRSHVDLEAMRVMFSNAERRGDLALVGVTFEQAYWGNYFRMLHNKAGSIPARVVVRLYLDGLRRYPRRGVRIRDLYLLIKVVLHLLLPSKIIGAVRKR